jgi:hypothetical protein
MKIHTLSSVLIIFCSFILCEVSLLAKDYYVSLDGNNATGDGSIGNPWQTIGYALDYINPGDILYLRAGVYNEQVLSVRSGTANAYITIAAYNNEEAIIDGTGVDGRNGVIIDHSYLKLIGFNVRNWEDVGVWLRNCEFNELLKLKITSVTGGIALTGTVHDFVIDSCIMYDYYGGAGGLGFDATPYENDRIYNGVIKNSKAYITAGAFDNADGFALGHDGVSDIYIYNCEAYGVGDGFDISGRNITLERCSAHNCNYGGGYKLWRDSVTLINCIGYNSGTNLELDFDRGTNKGVKARLINCTFYNSWVYNINIENTTGGSRLEMYNCILAGTNNTGLTFDGTNIACYKGDYNLFHGNNTGRLVSTSLDDYSLEMMQNGDWTAASGQDAHSRFVFDASLLFLDTNGIQPDLHLKSGSVAINNGTNLPDAPSFDFDNCPRNVGQIDIGAFEFDACGASEVIENNFTECKTYNLEQNYPNPFNQTTTIRFSLPGYEHVTLIISDVLGNKVATLIDEYKVAGTYSSKLDVHSYKLSSGIYSYRLQTENFILTKNMIFIK